MGQTIEVQAQQVGSVVIFDTDRSITGQDGSGFARADLPTDPATAPFPAQLAARLYADVDDVDHVFIASNQVVVKRDVGWNDATIDAAAEIIGQFFRFYPD